jgi:hypothetical protein
VSLSSKPPLSLGEQAARFRRAWPESWTVFELRRGIHAIGKVRPTPLSAEYLVRLNYFHSDPSVHVITPALRCREDAQRIPHSNYDGSLCLYYASAQEWTPAMALADTVVRWISEWLFYYEIWFVTGLWCGGGIPAGRAS